LINSGPWIFSSTTVGRTTLASSRPLVLLNKNCIHWAKTWNKTLLVRGTVANCTALSHIILNASWFCRSYDKLAC